MSWQQRKALLEQRADVQKQMKQILDKADTEKRDLSAEDNGKFDELATRSDTLTGQISRYDRMLELEAEGRSESQPGRDDVDGGKENETRSEQTNADETEQRRAEAVNAYLRNGREGLKPEQRNLIVVGAEEQRALGISSFGVVGTRTTYKKLVDVMKIYSGVREAGAEVISTATGNPLTIPTADDTGNEGQVLAENAEETNMTDATVGNVELNAYKHSSKWIRVSIELMQDTEFDLEAFVMKIAGERNGRKFNKDATNGDGANKPRGFVTAAVAANMYVAAALNATISYEDVLDLQNKVDASYWKSPKAGFMFNQTTLTGARKIKGTDGHPIWTPAFGDVSETILGKKLTLNNELGSFGSALNTVVAAYGDWDKYKVRDVTSPVIIRATEKFAEFGQIGFLVFSRHDGDQTDVKSLAVLRLPAAA